MSHRVQARPGWLSAEAWDTGWGGNTRIHADPLCSSAKGARLNPVKVSGPRVWLTHARSIPAVWCVYCHEPEMPGEWARKAACRGAPDDWFFPDVDGPNNFRRGRKVCSACPVLSECRRFGLATLPPYGLLGGLSPRQRQEMVAGRAKLTAAGKEQP